jgi:peroxiredoxin
LNLVVAFLGRAGCDEFLHDLAARREDFEFDDAEVLIVIQGTAQEVEQRVQQYRLPFPVLADATGDVHRSFGAIEDDEGCTPTVYVLDRFGEIYATYPFGGEYKLPSADDLLNWIQFIELQCPE